MDNIKINSINMFINKFLTNGDVINLEILKENFRLDEGETGFYRLSLSQKIVLGNETINETYNRPPIGPIDEGFYCSYCGSVGPEDHLQTCNFPVKDSLNLTLGGFKDLVLNNTSYSGDYSEIKQKILSQTVTQEDLNKILLNEDDLRVFNGNINIDQNRNTLTDIPFNGIYKKRGSLKRANKTSTTQFLNNMIIYHEEDDLKTSIRISKNGLINLINVPSDNTKLEAMITELIRRINETDAVNIDEFNDTVGTNNYTQYEMINDPDITYIHSMTAQFQLDAIKSGLQVNFSELDNLISPFDQNGNLLSSDVTNVIRVYDTDVIDFQGIKIIDWEYSTGKMTVNQWQSQEYIKLTVIPDNGVKLTAVIKKYGAIMMTLSLCNKEQNDRGLCGEGRTPIIKEMMNNFVTRFNDLFTRESSILTSKTLSDETKGKLVFNTVSGYAPSGKICRLTRTRDTGAGNYKEGMRPDPYSWKGTCPDPNYQYLKPEGVQDEDGLWYPCCETKTKESVLKMRNYLLNGFPRNIREGEEFDITPGVDLGSGILVPGSNEIGASTKVKIDGIYQDVTVMKKLSKKSNEYIVRKTNGEKVTVKGTDFMRDSRSFPGLRSLTKFQLISCISNTLKNVNKVVSLDGSLKINDISELEEKFDQELFNKINNLIDLNSISVLEFNYNTIKNFKEESYDVRKVPKNSYNFFLLLSPEGNYYITKEGRYVDSSISTNFNKTVLLDGFLTFNENEFKNEFHIIDLVYDDQDLTSLDFEERYLRLYQLQNTFLNTIVDDILLLPDVINDIIEGSHDILQTDPDSKLVFINKQTCCKKIIWGEIDKSEDTIELQVLSKDRNVIKFGHSDREFSENIGLDFLNNYAFNKRDIPPELYINNYIKVKINRDFTGKVVPNRKISLLDKTDRTLDYDEVTNILLTKFNEIESLFFSSPDEWILSTEVLVSNGEILIEQEN